MNIEELRKLSPEDQRRYIEIEKRYESPAWRFVREWCTEQINEAQHRAAHAEDWAMNRMNMGAVTVLQLLLAQEDMDYQEFQLKLAEVDEEVPADAGDLQL